MHRGQSHILNDDIQYVVRINFDMCARGGGKACETEQVTQAPHWSGITIVTGPVAEPIQSRCGIDGNRCVHNGCWDIGVGHAVHTTLACHRHVAVAIALTRLMVECAHEQRNALLRCVDILRAYHCFMMWDCAGESYLRIWYQN